MWIVTSISFLFFQPSTSVVLVCFAVALISFGGAAGNLCTWSMLSCTYEVDELITSKRHEGLYSGMSTFTRKAASSVAMLLLGFGLQAVGFNQDEYNRLKLLGDAAGMDSSLYASSNIILAIRVLFVVVPVILLTFTIVFTVRYKLNMQRFELVLRSVQLLKDGAGLDSLSMSEKEDLVLVSGHSIEDLWDGQYKTNIRES